MQQMGQGALSELGKRGRQGADLHELSVNKPWKVKRAYSGPVISHCLK
jgi:hypothetical protein